jgi:pSer/pThr/pTyr-binding forkhead associated (FHA) protein
MKNDTQQIDPTSDSPQQIASDKLEAVSLLNEQIKDASQDSHEEKSTIIETIFDNSQKSASSPEVHQLKTNLINTSFQPEETPQMGMEHFEKVAVAASVSASAPSTPSQNWSIEKTLLINDDENTSASFVRLDTKQRFNIDLFPFIIGRAQDSQLQLEDMSLSRHHAKVQKTESGLSIEDLDSSNGITVNDINVDQVLLMEGDVITLGHIKLRFELKSVSPFPEKTGKVANEFLERISLTHPNWKKVTAGVIGTILIGTLYYKSQIDDRIMVSELAVASNTSQPSKAEQTKANTHKTSAKVVADNATTPTQKVPKDIAQLVPSSPSIQTEIEQTNNSAKKTETTKENPAAMDITATEVSPTSVKKGQNVNNSEQHKPDPKLILSRNNSNKTITNTTQKSPKATRESKSIPATSSEIKARTNKSIKRLSLSAARKLYQQGEATKAIAMLDNLSTNPRLSKHLQNKALLLKTKVVNLHTHYQQGLQAYENNNKNQAWDDWTTFIIAEKKLKLPTTSKFAENIKLHILTESSDSNQMVKQNNPEASAVTQENWKPNSQQSINNKASSSKNTELENNVRDLYRDGYRLEHSNLAKAIERWHRVVNLATPNSEYYTKAKAKLRFYEEVNP